MKPIGSKRDPWKGSKITICAFGLLEASWSGLGAVLEGSRVEKKVLLNGSWPLQEEFHARFEPSWGPTGFCQAVYTGFCVQGTLGPLGA